MHGRLDAHYIDEQGDKQIPVMIHRAILGSLERFIGILIEEHAGKMPLWLSPVHAVVMGITDNQAEYVQKIEKNLKKTGFRVVSDLRNEKIGFKIREHTLSRIPYILVVGDREIENSTIAVRTRDGEDLGAMTIEELAGKMSAEISDYGL